MIQELDTPFPSVPSDFFLTKSDMKENLKKWDLPRVRIAKFKFDPAHKKSSAEVIIQKLMNDSNFKNFLPVTDNFTNPVAH
jgi:hypothetical protein